MMVGHPGGIAPRATGRARSLVAGHLPSRPTPGPDPQGVQATKSGLCGFWRQGPLTVVDPQLLRVLADPIQLDARFVTSAAVDLEDARRLTSGPRPYDVKTSGLHKPLVACSHLYL